MKIQFKIQKRLKGYHVQGMTLHVVSQGIIILLMRRNKRKTKFLIHQQMIFITWKQLDAGIYVYVFHLIFSSSSFRLLHLHYIKPIITCNILTSQVPFLLSFRVDSKKYFMVSTSLVFLIFIDCLQVYTLQPAKSSRISCSSRPVPVQHGAFEGEKN